MKSQRLFSGWLRNGCVWLIKKNRWGGITCPQRRSGWKTYIYIKTTFKFPDLLISFKKRRKPLIIYENGHYLFLPESRFLVIKNISNYTSALIILQAKQLVSTVSCINKLVLASLSSLASVSWIPKWPSFSYWVRCLFILVLLMEIFLHQGWMNEIYNYDPETYHATLTHSVFVRLEGGTLRLSKPNKNISRRASYNETKPEVTYISQKIYDLSDSKVSLILEA